MAIFNCNSMAGDFIWERKWFSISLLIVCNRRQFQSASQTLSFSTAFLFHQRRGRQGQWARRFCPWNNYLPIYCGLEHERLWEKSSAFASVDRCSLSHISVALNFPMSLWSWRKVQDNILAEKQKKKKKNFSPSSRTINFKLDFYTIICPKKKRKHRH